MILIVLLILVERIVLVDIFHIRGGFIRCIITLGAAVAIRRVALRVVDILVSIQDGCLLLVPVGTAEIVIVVTCRVGKDAVEHRLVHLALNLVKIGTLVEFLLLGIGESVEAHILQGTAAAGSGECVGHGALGRNLTPLCIGKAIAAIHRHTTLVKFLSVSQNILAHLSQVDVEVATIVGGISLVLGVDEWVEHPELDVFHVGLLKVVGIQLSHHTTPVALRVLKLSVGLQVVHIEVIRTRLRWIVSQVEHAQRVGGSLIGALLAQWEELLYIHLSYIVITQLLQVALDVTRGQRTASAGEERVDAIPGKTGAMEAAGQARLVVVIFLEVEGWYTRNNP